MAHIVCVSDGMTSVVYSVLELARRLAVDGHRVTFVGRPERRALALRQGLAFEALPCNRSAGYLASDARSGPISRLLRLRSRRAAAVASLGMEDFAAQLRRLDPQLVLIDGEMHECVIVSAGAGRRTAVLNSFCSIWRRPGLPPPHTLIRPSVGWRGSRLGMALHWSVLRWRKRRRALKQWLQHVGCDRRSRLRALADRHRVDLRAAADAGQWLIPWTYRSLPALSLHAREFDFPHEPPAHVHYFGPMVLRCRNDGSTGDEADADSPRPVDGVQLGDVLKRARTDNRALVYAAFGSTFTASSGIVAQLVAAARDERWSLVLSLGGGDPADLGLLPANVHAFRWLPQLEVLRCADVAIIHGGINTIDECVLSGVPMLVYCGFETDMAGNTARVVYHGLGIAGDPRRDGPLEVRRHLERLLTERRFRDAVARFRPLVERLERDRVAERTVAALLSPER